MRNPVIPAIVLFTLLARPAAAGQAAPAQSEEDLSIQGFVQALETTLSTTERERWIALLSPNNDRQAASAFFDSFVPQGVTRAVVHERDRVPLQGALPGEGYQLLVDTFIETDARGRIYTWSLDVRRPRESEDRQPWRIVSQEKLSAIEGLHRLGLNTDKQYAASDLVLRSVDLELQLRSGDVFVTETSEGVTGVVMLGDGMMSFTPAPAEERGQVRIFAGSDSIETPFTAVFVRFNPFEFDLQMKPQLGAPVPVDARALRRAQDVFDEEVSKSFSLDLRDLSRDNWSLLPQTGDFLAEIRTRRFNTLTFARSLSEAEDVMLFHRARQRNIASYASEMKLSSRGRFFDEDDLVEYDVLDYDLNVSFSPERRWLEGQARLQLRIKVYALAALTIRLADELNVSSITADKLGRLMFLRVRNQNNVVINLPAPLPRDTVLTLTIGYAGSVRPQSIDEESTRVGPQGRPGQRSDDLPFIPPEPNWLFSNRSHWYPQNQVSDYASATVRFNVPAEFKVIASGIEPVDSPMTTVVDTAGNPVRVTYLFESPQPLRYIGAVISKFSRVDRAGVAVDVDGDRNTITLAVDANRRQQDRGRDIVLTAAEILRLYASYVGEVPYDSFTIAMVEDGRPGGHSPAYFAMLNNPPPLMPWLRRQDPAAFNNYPEFYLAHEIAHQWWGQAVGWKNYHEQWLSEGLAQYFAVLYAKERHGDQVFRDVIRHLRRWAMSQSDQGAVYLGYRLGHIKGDSRVFRAIVYNKGASVLHMLRRLIGDDAFFRGLRRYYTENRFKKAGTEDLQRAMEAEADRSLTRFFEQWIYASGLPRIRYSTATEGQELVVRFEQVGEVYDVPVTVTLNYNDRSVDEIVPLDEATVEKRFPLAGSLRNVAINDDHAALGHFDRR
ncbi:MAG TPA: M1 family aminopeptidase [Vicinamibacterales bacterium]|nr:M1 family aminopeptidase [Vicinamibacterales bacterium]